MRDELTRLLGTDYLRVGVLETTVLDDMAGMCKAVITLSDGSIVTGQGVGMVDALFSAFKGHYSREYQSLNSVELGDFAVRILKASNNRVDGLDVKCTVGIVFRNSYGTSFEFKSSGRSLSAESARAVAAGVEHFVNAERAYVSLYRALKDAHSRNRQDLVARFTYDMAQVVRCTSYAEIIERIEDEIRRSED